MVAVVMGCPLQLGDRRCGLCLLRRGLSGCVKQRPSEKGVQTAFSRAKKQKAAWFENQAAFVLSGGGKRDRTADLLHAMQALYQLSYTPKFFGGESGTRTPDTRIMIPLL